MHVTLKIENLHLNARDKLKLYTYHGGKMLTL